MVTENHDPALATDPGPCGHGDSSQSQAGIRDLKAQCQFNKLVWLARTALMITTGRMLATDKHKGKCSLPSCLAWPEEGPQPTPAQNLNARPGDCHSPAGAARTSVMPVSQTSRATDSCSCEDLLVPLLFLSLRVAQSKTPGFYDTRLCCHWASNVVYETMWVPDTEKSRALSA